MKEKDKTKDQLVKELTSLRHQLAELKTLESERTQAQEARRESEERYRTLVEHTYDFVIEASLDGRFLYLSSDYTEVLGYEPDELLGRNIFELMHPDDLSAAITAFTRGVETFTSDQAVFRYRHKNGEWRWFEGTGRPFRTATGETRVIVVSRDVTERKQAEEALQEEAQISAALARVGREMISSLNTPEILSRLCQLTAAELGCDCSHTLLSQSQEDSYVPVAGWGDTPEQWETLRLLKVPSEAMSRLLERLKREVVVEVLTSAREAQTLLPHALSLGFGITASFYLALRRGEEIIGIQTAAYRGGAGPFTATQHRIALGIAQLASMALENARLLEQAEGANRLKSDFLATISHELRTPLHIIMGYNDLLLEGEFGDPSEGQVETLKRIERSARELMELINAILDVGRLEAGRLPVEFKKVAVAELVAEVAAETQDLRENASLEFAWRVAPGLPPLYTDPTKLKVVLKNLVANAVKFTPEGGITVDVHTCAGGVEVRVTDTGIGIAPEALPVIFEPFRQVESALTRHHSGVGLGLYIVRRMLDLLGGRISVESELGRGSTFRAWIPSGGHSGRRLKAAAAR